MPSSLDGANRWQARKVVNYADPASDDDEEGPIRPAAKAKSSRASKRRKVESESDDDVFADDAGSASDLDDEGESFFILEM